MAYKLLQFYKKNLSLYNMVFKHMKIQLFLFTTLPFATGAIIVMIWILNKKIYFESFLLIAIPLFILFLIVNAKAKKVVKNIYGISSKEFMWNSFEVIDVIRNHEKKKMIKYLKESYKDMNKDDIKKLSDTILNEGENLKVKFPLIPSIFAALFISLWNNFFSWVYKYENVKDFEVATKIFLISSMALVMIIALVLMIKSFLGTIADDIFNGDYRKMKKLSELLKEIYDDMERKSR